jgi:hypothetical protein
LSVHSFSVGFNGDLSFIESFYIPVPRSPESVLRSMERCVLEGIYDDKQQRKRKRAFHRLITGFTRALHRGERLYFMTLSSCVGYNPKNLSRDFQVLRKRIEHKWGFQLAYWKINTSEGNGVMHIVYKFLRLNGDNVGLKGGFIPVRWLSKVWREITGGSRIVDVKPLNNKPGRLANYLLSQYLTGQSYERMSWSASWVFRGFCKVWRRDFSGWYLVDREACLKAWNSLICGTSFLRSSPSGSLSATYFRKG